MNSPKINTDNNLKRTAISSAQWKFTATIVISILALLQLFILTKIVGAAVFGVIAIGKVVLGFLTNLSDSGMRNAVLVKQDLSNKLFSSIYWINMGLVICLSAFTYWITPWISAMYEMPTLTPVIHIFILAFATSGMGAFYKTSLQKNMYIKAISIIEIIAMLFGVVIAIIWASKNPSPIALAYGVLAQLIISSIGYIIVGYKIYPLKFEFQTKELRYFFRFGSYQIGERMLNYFHSKMDILIIGKLLGSEILGVYDIFKQLLNRPESLINPVLDFVALPIMAKNQMNKNQIGRMYIKMMSYSATILFPIYSILILIAPFFVKYFFGNVWLEHTFLFQLLALYFIVHSMLNHVGTLWVAVDRPEVGFYWNLAVWLILPITLFFAAQYNIEIVVIVMIIVLAFLFYPMYVFVIRKLVSISFIDYIFSLIPPLLISFITIIPFYYLTKMIPSIIVSILSSLGYAILVLVMLKLFHKKIFDELKSLLLR